jgi:hypothetical protein
MPRVLRYPRDLHLCDRLRIGMAMVDSLPKFLVSCAKEPYKNGALVQKKKFGEPDNRCHPISAYPLSQTNPLHDTVLLLLAHSWPKVRVLLSPVLCLSTRELARTHTHMMMHVRTHARPIRDLQQYFTDVSPLPCVCMCERESSVFCSNISPTCITSTGSVSA